MEQIDKSLDKYSNEINNDKDKLAIIIHLIMLQSGLRYIENEFDILKQTKGSQFNKLYYNQTKIDFKSKDADYYQLKNNLIIVILQSGGNVDINAKYADYSSSFIKQSLKEFFYEPQFYVTKKLNLNQVTEKFEIDFKNKILNPFKFYLKQNELNTNFLLNNNYINGLIELPIELVFNLALNYLDINSIVALNRTNKYFYNLFNSDTLTESSLWLKLIKRDFKKESTNLTSNYRSQYVKLYFNRRLFNKKYN